MSASTSNLFISLYRWVRRHPENFLTESFGHILDVWRVDEPTTFCDFVAWFTAGIVRLTPDHCGAVEIATQVSAGQNKRPDLEIRGDDFLIWVEIKDTSPINREQLDNYSELLSGREELTKVLVFLSRSGARVEGVPLLVSARSWTTVADEVESTRNRLSRTESPALHHLLGQFLNFLKERGMAIGKAGPELVPGVVALNNLMAMVLEALQSTVRGQVRGAGVKDAVGYLIIGSDGREMARCVLDLEDASWLRLGVKPDFVNSDTEDEWEDPQLGEFNHYLPLVDEDDPASGFLYQSADEQRAAVAAFIRTWLGKTTIPLQQQ